MKRLTAILLTGMMIFTLASCGKKAQDTPTELQQRHRLQRRLRCYGNGSRNRGCKRYTADRSAAGRTDCRTAGRGAEQFR